MTQYYIGSPELNSEPITEVNKCDTQLGICSGPAKGFDYC